MVFHSTRAHIFWMVDFHETSVYMCWYGPWIFWLELLALCALRIFVFRSLVLTHAHTLSIALRNSCAPLYPCVHVSYWVEKKRIVVKAMCVCTYARKNDSNLKWSRVYSWSHGGRRTLMHIVSVEKVAIVVVSNGILIFCCLFLLVS